MAAVGMSRGLSPIAVGRRTAHAVLLAIGLTVLLPSPVAQANLDVAPTRLSIQDGERAATLMVINRGDAPRTFRVTVVDTEEHEDGGRELLREPRTGFPHAASMIRYSPRQATLDPGERQVVRFQVRRPADLREGEYRARVVVQTLPTARPSAEPGVAGQGVALDIEVLFAVTLPIAIVHGAPDVEVGIGGARATEDGGLEIEVNRRGARSSYGALLIYAGERAAGRPVARRHRAVVAVPLERRRFHFQDLGLSPGDRIHVVYQALEEEGGGVKAARTLTVE